MTGFSLADLRANPQPSPAQRSTKVCAAPDLVAELISLAEDLNNLPEVVVDDDGKPAGPPRRVGQGPDAERAELQRRYDEMHAKMSAASRVLVVRDVIGDGAWRRWCNEHPARDEGEPGHNRDREVAGGYCNADDLLDSLGRFAYSWDGELIGDGDWELLSKRFAPSDKKRIATLVTSMYDGNLDIPKLLSDLRPILSESAVSGSVGISASVPDAS